MKACHDLHCLNAVEWRLAPTHHAEPAGSQIFARAPNHVNTRRMTSHRFRVQLEDRRKRDRIGNVWALEQGQCVYFVGDKVHIPLLAEPEAVLDNRSRIALARRIVRVGKDEPLDWNLRALKGFGQRRYQRRSRGIVEPRYVDRNGQDIGPNGKQKVEAICRDGSARYEATRQGDAKHRTSTIKEALLQYGAGTRTPSPGSQMLKSSASRQPAAPGAAERCAVSTGTRGLNH